MINSPADNEDETGVPHDCLEWCPICRGAELLEASIPPELQEQFRTVQRDALLMAQAMIESHLARLQDARRRSGSGAGGGWTDGRDGRRGDGDPSGKDPPLEDIPIE